MSRNEQLRAVRLFLHDKVCMSGGSECGSRIEHAKRFHGTARRIVGAYREGDPSAAVTIGAAAFFLPLREEPEALALLGRLTKESQAKVDGFSAELLAVLT